MTETEGQMTLPFDLPGEPDENGGIRFRVGLPTSPQELAMHLRYTHGAMVGKDERATAKRVEEWRALHRDLHTHNQFGKMGLPHRHIQEVNP